MLDIDRREAMLQILRHAGGLVSGADLAAQLHVSTRSVRQYVRGLNDRAGEDLVRASHRGYGLNLAAYRRFRKRRQAPHAQDGRCYDTPQQRLYYLSRTLMVEQETVAVFELADKLSVSLDTIESDLARAREFFHTYGLALRRDRDVLRVEGSERDKRQLVRQVLLDSASGATPVLLQAFAADYPHFDLRTLRTRVHATLRDSGLPANDYLLTDVLVHLTIAADRVRHGHTLEDHEDTAESGPVAELVDELAEVVDATLGISLPPGERKSLRRLVSSRGQPRVEGEPGVSPEIMQMVRDTARAVSDYYLLELGDEANVASLALHVQSLITRARAGDHLRAPLGPSFKAMHPVIHEIALLFAARIEDRTGIVVGEGEVDFLAFHLGTQFQQQLGQGPLLTITLVTPQYHDTHLDIADRLASAVAGHAVVEAVITEMDHDWSQVASDLIVSVVELPTTTFAPVVRIGPFLTLMDIEAVRAVVERERHHIVAQKLRANVLSLIEPQLFHRVNGPVTRRSAIEAMCAAMVEAGAADEGFVGDVLDRERRSSTAFGERFAVPHSLYMDAPRTAISVLISDAPIPWDDAAVQLVVLFSASADQRLLFREVLDQLIAVLSQPAHVAELLAHGGDHHSFVRALGQMLDQ